MAALPVVAIVGRPNVGKSSLFNRLLRRRQAIVDRVPGVTRDRLEAPLTWRGRSFTLVDTGGLAFERPSALAEAIYHQVICAIEEADLLLLVCDAVQGAMPLDAHVVDLLRRAGKPVLVVAHKADTEALADRAVEFYTFGFGPPIPVSSSHGRGVGELLDTIVERLPGAPAAGAGPAASAPTVAIVGRPNVGKSSFLNRWLGRERVTVDAVPGTTRDAVAVAVEHGPQALQLIDTAGIRARPKLKTLVDIVSVKRSISAVEQADVCLMLMDVSVGLLADDLTVLGRILKVGTPCVIAMNKWDLMPASDPETCAQAIWQRAPFAAFVPILATSTMTGYHVPEALQMAAAVAARGRCPIPRGSFKAVVRHLQETEDLPARLRQVRFVQLRQMAQRPLTLELTLHGRGFSRRAGQRLRHPDLLFLEHAVRHRIELAGVPVRFTVRVV